MAISTMATAEKALKEYFIEPARVQLDEGSGPFLAMIEKSTEEVTGHQIRMPLKYGRHGGIGNRADDGLLPTPSPRKWEHAVWDTKNIFARIMLTDKLIKASKNNKGAFANQLASQMEDLTIDAKDNLRRQVFGSGEGTVTTVSESGTGNKLAVANVTYLSEGQFIDIFDSTTDVAVAEGVEIIVREKTEVGSNYAGYITVSGESLTFTKADYITIAGNKDLELTGMSAIFTPDTKLYGINRATNKWFNPHVKSIQDEGLEGVEELNELIMQEMIDEAKDELGSDINFISCNSGVARAFQFNQLSYKKNIDYMDLIGGYKAMKFGTIPITKEKYEKPGVMRFLCKDNFKLYRMGGWDWMDKDGAVLNRVSNKPAYEATLVMYGDLGCDKPRGQSLLTGISEH